MELYKKYRPKTLKELIGNETVKETLRAMAQDKEKFPHCILLQGPSGTGKTTIARIIKRILECSSMDFHELNIAQARGIDDARDIIRKSYFAPTKGKSRIFLLDEVHMATKEFFNCMLKSLEDTPSHCYFILATTNPEKLPKTIKTRSTILNTYELSEIEIAKGILYPVCKAEKAKIPKNVIMQIARDSLGSARTALVILNSIIKLKPEDMLDHAKRSAAKESKTIELCRILIKSRRWGEVAPILKSLLEQGEEPEAIRRQVLGYYASVMLNGNERAYEILNMFRDSFFESGKAGLVLACYESIIKN